VVSTSCSITVSHSLKALRQADTIVLAGLDHIGAQIPMTVASELRRAAARGCRIASICTGAFILAATSLLNVSAWAAPIEGGKDRCCVIRCLSRAGA
jgi:transcriptional regulator GlxA family with amidase domain